MLKLGTKWGYTLRQNIHKHNAESPELPKNPCCREKIKSNKMDSKPQVSYRKLVSNTVRFYHSIVSSCIMEAIVFY